MRLQEIAQRPSELRSLEVDFFGLNGFQSYYQFRREKNDWHMLGRERREISLPFLLVNCHDVTGRIFERWFSHQPEKNNNKRIFSKSKKSIVSVTFSVKARLIRTLWHGVASVTHSVFVQIFGSKIQDFFQTFFQNNIFFPRLKIIK